MSKGIVILSLAIALAVSGGLRGQTDGRTPARPVWPLRSRPASISAAAQGLFIYYQVGGLNNSPQQTTTLVNKRTQQVAYTVELTAGGSVSGRVWAAASPASGTIPAGGSAQLVVGYDTSSNLPPGTYDAVVTVTTSRNSGCQPGTYGAVAAVATSGNGACQVDIPVHLVVSTAPQLNVLPADLSFFCSAGGSPPPAQVVMPTATNLAPGVDRSASVRIAISTSTEDGGAWLFAPSLESAGIPFPVAVVPGNLAPGTYHGAIAVSATGVANNPQIIPVTLKVVSAPVAQINSSWVSLMYANPPPPLAVTSSTGAPLDLSATVSSSTSICGDSWLAATVGQAGTASGLIAVALKTVGPIPKVCLGAVTVNAVDPATGVASYAVVQVAAYVNGGPYTVVTPSAPLVFTAPAGSTANLFQTFTVSLTDGTSDFSSGFAASAAADGTVIPSAPNEWNSWLGIGWLTAPGALGLGAIDVDPGRLAPGTYDGIVSFSGPLDTATPNTVIIPVRLNVTGKPQ